jgi:hypothetical protein
MRLYYSLAATALNVYCVCVHAAGWLPTRAAALLLLCRLVNSNAPGYAKLLAQMEAPPVYLTDMTATPRPASSSDSGSCFSSSSQFAGMSALLSTRMLYVKLQYHHQYDQNCSVK